MRLNRLDLLRWGRFADQTIDFPRPSAGAPDVTIVYGPNEAGKSTAFAGFVELLFGLKSGAHPCAFRWDRKDLLVGAELDLLGLGPTTLRRNGKTTQSLLDGELRPVNDLVLSQHLFGLTQAAFETRFSLNEETLRKGGEEIAKASGDLGQLLYAGVSGLSQMTDALDRLASEADQFHKKRGRATVLGQAKTELEAIARDLKDKRLTPEKERALVQACTEAGVAYDAAEHVWKTALAQQEAARAAVAWFEAKDGLEAREAALKALPDGPPLPERAGETVAAQVERRATAQQSEATAQADIAACEKVLAETAEDPVAPQIALELADLADQTFDGATLLERAGSAAADLAKRRDELDELAAKSRAALARIDPSATETLVLDAATLEALTEAAERAVDAEAALARAEAVVATAREGLGAEPPAPRDLTELRKAWEALSLCEDPDGLDRQVGDRAEHLAQVSAGLPDGWSDLVPGMPSGEAVRDASTAVVSARMALDGAEATLDEARRSRDEAEAARGALEADPAAMDAVRRAEIRAARDRAWTLHRGALTEATAEAFEAALRRDDAAGEAYQLGSDRRARLEGARAEAEKARFAFGRARAKRRLAARALAQAETVVARQAQALGLAPGTAARGIEPRREALVAADAAQRAVAAMEAQRDQARGRRDAALAVLQAAAQAVGIEAQGPALQTAVNAALVTEDAVRKARAAWEGQRDKLAEQTAARDQAKAACDLATQALARCTDPLPLPERSARAVRAAVPSMRDMASFAEQSDKLSRRITQMEGALATLRGGASRIAELLDMAFTAEGDPMAIVTAAKARVKAAEAANAVRRQAEKDLAKARAAREAAAKTQAEADTALAAVFAEQGGAAAEPGARIAMLRQRDGLRRDRAEYAAAMARCREGIDPALFDAECAVLPDPTRGAVLAAAATDAETLRLDARDQKSAAERALQAARAETDPGRWTARQAFLREDLRAGARDALVRRIGETIARSALRRLAEERRSEMLQDVRDAFLAITAPAWQGVEVWSEDQGETLRGVDASGNPVRVEAMSTGTKAQLYFALRLAGYRSFVRTAGPLPMVLDDIMETFDDTRARATLRLCGEVGQIGQAIIFTHHPHLVTLAQEVLPGVGLAEIPPRVPA